MSSLRERLISDGPLLGSFIKTPAVHPIEILASAGFDFVVVDEEHAPFDRAATDVAIVAARAAGILPFVRLADGTPPRILAALDGAAIGVLVPHVTDGAMAGAVVRAASFHGNRGYSGATRAAGFGTQTMSETLSQASEVILVAQIEDRSGLDNIDAIVGTEGIDAVFIGRADLAVSLGASDGMAAEVMLAAEQIAAAAHRVSKAVAIFAANAAEAISLASLGASLIVVASDQAFLRSAAAKEIRVLRPVPAHHRSIR